MNIIQDIFSYAFFSQLSAPPTGTKRGSSSVLPSSDFLNPWPPVEALGYKEPRRVGAKAPLRTTILNSLPRVQTQSTRCSVDTYTGHHTALRAVEGLGKWHIPGQKLPGRVGWTVAVLL